MPERAKEPAIKRSPTRTVLFVCTGNTCRSPMAEALARFRLGRVGDNETCARVSSAGAAAGDGAPASPEAVQAVRSLGGSLEGHRSRPLTKDLIRESSIIFALTHSHADAIRSVDPGSIDRVFLLDPEGEDVEDPIGQPQGVYDNAARHIDTLIQHRFQELGIN